MDKEIYIVRHGRTDFNRRGVWQGSGVDAALDGEGREQARSFYESYKGRDFDLVVYSGLQRSKQTIQAFLEDGIEGLLSTDINEISWGRFEGKPHTEESLGAYKALIKAWSQRNYDVCLEGGESANQLFKRMSKFRKEVIKIKKKRVLICSHGRAIRAMLAVFKGEEASTMEKYTHANTGVFIGKLVGEEFSFSTYNLTDHIPADGI